VLVCHCRVVTDRAVRAAVADGAQDLDGVAQRCGAGTGCGGCVPLVEQLVADAVLALEAPDRLLERQRERRLTPRPAFVGAPA
jgi:bacterioferritin-associated ferredoxin